MWAGRLRQDGKAFAALGPAKTTAMLKGNGKQKGARQKAKVTVQETGAVGV